MHVATNDFVVSPYIVVHRSTLDKTLDTDLVHDSDTRNHVFNVRYAQRETVICMFHRISYDANVVTRVRRDELRSPDESPQSTPDRDMEDLLRQRISTAFTFTTTEHDADDVQDAVQSDEDETELRLFAAPANAASATLKVRLSSPGLDKGDGSGFLVKKPKSYYFADEPTSDEENMADAVQIGLPNAPAQPAEKQEPQSPDAERKPKAKIKGIAEPVLQTDEDRAEWARFQSNLRHIRAELGPEEIPQVDGSGDVVMAEASSNTEKKPTVRDNNVYLFQIPPLMPELNPPTIKIEASDPLPLPKPAQPAAKVGDAKIKLEEGGFSDPSARSTDGPRFGSGIVGKLRVHESGRTTLDWGGTSYELTPGNKASFLQEVTSLRIEPPAERVVPEAGGDAVSFGRVKGKFVVVPNWGEMLG